MKSIHSQAAISGAFSAFDEEDCDRATEPAGETVFADSVSDALKAAAPEGSTVRAVGFDNTDIFLRAGYRVTDGDAFVTVARGGMREFDVARKTVCRKLVLCPTHAFGSVATALYRTTDGAFAVTANGQKPHYAVFDAADMDNNLAAVFAELICLDLAAFDHAFGACMRGERADANIERGAAELAENLARELCGREKDKTFVRSELIRAGKAAARLIESTPELMFASGATQVTEALRMMYAKEERNFPMHGEEEFMLAPYVTELYIKSIARPRTAALPLPPPDNNRRIDSVCEYLGADLVRACLHVTPVFPPRKLLLYEYRRDEFRAELLKKLTALKARQSAAWNVFKRLYPDDGFGLKSLIDKTDVGLCTALAPDVFSSESMLAFLKQSGELEKYLI